MRSTAIKDRIFFQMKQDCSPALCNFPLDPIHTERECCRLENGYEIHLPVASLAALLGVNGAIKINVPKQWQLSLGDKLIQRYFDNSQELRRVRRNDVEMKRTKFGGVEEGSPNN